MAANLYTIKAPYNWGTFQLESIANLRHFIDATNFGKVLDGNYYLLSNGKLFNESNPQSTTIEIIPRLNGGKGGFGSMLRAIGAQIEKTTNREACRDLSGRRLRDINEEKRLKKWIEEKAEREKEQAERKKKKLEKMLSEPKHEFSDPDYERERSELIEKVHEAVEEGLKAARDEEESEPGCSKSLKRKLEEKPVKAKGLLWIDDNLNDDSEEESENDEDTSTEAPKRIKV